MRKARSDYSILGPIFLLVLIVGLLREHSKTLIIGLLLLIITLVVVVIVLKRISHRLILRRSGLDKIDKMSGLDFERYVAGKLSARGYKYISLTERYDYGIDIVAQKDGIKWGIQVKRRSGLVKANAVRQVVTALKKYNCDRAMVITNGTYSNVAGTVAPNGTLFPSLLIPWAQVVS